MTQNKKLNFKIGLLAILTLLVFGIGCVLAYTTNANKVYADYEDLSSDAIVNFNQWVSDTYVSSYTYSGGYTAVDGTDFTSVSGHKYYISCYSSIACQLQFHSGSARQVVGIAVGQNNKMLTADSSSYNILYIWLVSGSTGTISNLFVIDVSQMYGIGNEPSLSQCQEIFTAEYYAYNIGSPIYNSYSSAYSQGYSDAFEDMETVFDDQLLYDSMFLVSGAYDLSSDYQYSLIGADPDNTSSLNTVVGINLNTTVSAGSIVTLSINQLVHYITADDTSTFTISLGSYSNNTFVPYKTIGSSALTRSGSHDGTIYDTTLYTDSGFSFSLPTATNVLYLQVIFSDTSKYQWLMLTDFNLNIRSTNVYLAIKTASESSYNDGYDKGYKAGKSYGESLGYENGLDAAENASFQTLFAAIIDAPVNVIASALDFDLLGINLKTFFFSLFTVALVITIIRIFI